MNCTQQEFENKVWTNYPAKYIHLELVGTDVTAFALDTQGECALPYFDKLKLAYFVWRNGSVIKDQTGIFSPVCTYPGSGSSPNSPHGGITNFVFAGSNPIQPSLSVKPHFRELTLDMLPDFEKYLLKCICGAHSVGSNRHSSWCDIKGDV